MTLVGSVARRQAPALFFILTVLLTWGLLPIMRLSPILAIAGLMTPAAAALIVIGLGEGRFGALRLARRLANWKAGRRWYLAALLLPPALSLLAAAVGSALTAADPASGMPELRPITPVALILLMIAAGEEIGWRGYALPKLLESFPPAAAAVILGLMWGVWRIPLFSLPGMPPPDAPAEAYLIYSAAASILYTWLFLGTKGGVAPAVVMHASGDIFIFTTPGLEPAPAAYLTAAVYLTAALAVTAVAGPGLKRGQ